MESTPTAADRTLVALRGVLVFKPGRSISDDYLEQIETAHILTWEEANRLLNTWQYHQDGRTVAIDFDWQPVITRLRQTYKVRSEIDQAVARGVEPDLRFPLRAVRVPFSVTVVGEPAPSRRKYTAIYHLESFVYDVFVMMNIAAPGCCAFDSARIRELPVRESERLWHDDFGLSDFSFDLANLDSLAGKWPPIRNLPLERVVSWYRSVRVGVAQIPNGRMEKTVFALMHIARLDISLNTVVWLFYALETFFDTRPGENFRTLVGRIGLLLSPTEAQVKLLKRSLRTLYDIRSAFVHGGRDVIHPQHNERLDPRVNQSFRELIDTTEFGFAVLLASVQEAASRGWTEMHFTESVSNALPTSDS